MSCQRAQDLDVAAFLVDADAPEFSEFRHHYPGCQECSSAVLEWTDMEFALREPPAGAVGVTPVWHPEPEMLAAYADVSALSNDERDRVRGHLEGCRPCGVELRALQDFDFSAVAIAVDASSEAADSEETPVTDNPIESVGAGFLDRLAGWLGLDGLCLPVPAAIGVVAALLVGLVFAFGGGLGDSAPGGDTRAPRMAQEEVPSERTPEPRIEPKVEAPSVPAPPVQIAIEGGSEPSVTLPGTESEVAPVEDPARPESPQESAAPVQRLAVESNDTIEVAPVVPTPVDPAPPVPAEESAPPREIVMLASFDALAVPRYAAPEGAESAAWMTELGVSRGEATTSIEALAPSHAGQSASGSPRLWWSIGSDTNAAVAFSLIDDREIDPVLYLELDGPHTGGLGHVDLAEHGVVLEPGVAYRWMVSVLADERASRNPISAGMIIRPEAGSEIAALVETLPLSERGHALAREGYWYDAYDFFASLAAAHPDHPRLAQFRDALYEAGRSAN